MHKLLHIARQQVNEAFLHWVGALDWPPELFKFVRFAFEGGKALRPALVHWSYVEAQRAQDIRMPQAVLAAALSAEMVHTYSLIHDDLPAMDNDDFRRGRPTLHRLKDEAWAVLSGDALLTGAFEILATHIKDSYKALLCVQELSRAVGGAGMIAGQLRDMNYRPNSLVDLEITHAEKTGALFGACFVMGVLLSHSHVIGVEDRSALRQWGRDFGVLFQHVDDWLDKFSSTQDLGKTQGKDERQAKFTFVNCVSDVVQAEKILREKRDQLFNQGRRWFCEKSLNSILDFMLARKN